MIRYSATSIGEDEETIIVFSGTVFREIVIWSPFRRSNALNILHRLQMHEVRNYLFIIRINPINCYCYLYPCIFKIGCYIFNHGEQIQFYYKFYI